MEIVGDHAVLQVTVSKFGEWDFFVGLRFAGGVSRCCRLHLRL